MHIYRLSITTKLLLISASLALIVILLTPSALLPYRSQLTKVVTTAQQKALNIPLFEDKTLSSGVVSPHTQGGKHLTGLNETLGAGTCALDYDGDGWIDILTLGGSGQTRFYGRPEWWQKKRGNDLYKNVHNGHFKNVTEESKLTAKTWSMGCTSADFDNDGDQDLFLTNIGENQLFRNNGDGTFTDITQQAGIKGNYWSTSVAVADYDNDGLLDIYIVNYLDYQKGSRTIEKASGFRSQTENAFNQKLYNSQSNQLFRNKGKLTFEDVTEASGTQNSSGRGLSAAWLDINNDFQSDIIVANDSGLPNVLYINNGNGTFSNASAQYKLNSSKSTRSISVGDIDNDGDSDLFMGTDSSIPLLAYINGSSPAYNTTPDQNSKGNAFTELSRDFGFADESIASLETWGISLQDFNNDGWLDLLAVNGFVTPDTDNLRLPKGQAKKMWLNQGYGRYMNCKSCGEDLNDRLSARGIAIADYDNDGDIDIYASHNNDMGQLLINHTSDTNWINLQLQGTKSNRDGIGAKVFIKTPMETQIRTLDSNAAFLSSGDKRLHFGLAREKLISEIKIVWPNREIQKFYDVKANQFIRIKQADDNFIKLKHNTLKKSSYATSFKDPLNHITALTWILNEGIQPLAEEELIKLYKSTNSKIRRKVIQQAGLNFSPSALSIFVSALKDQDIINRLLAIKNLQKAEDERTIRWLLRSFNDKHPMVRCATANTFAFFFRQEEAVINHKYLAVPHLIKMLSDSKPDVRACAANALGDAELYRGAIPLIQLLNDNKINVRVAAARALGLIREKTALSPLLAVIENAKQPPAVKFQSLVALKRLQYPDIEKLINNALNKAITEKNDLQLYNLTAGLLLLISDHEDGVTIRATSISKIISKVFTEKRFTHINNKNILKSQLNAIDILRIAKNTTNLKTIKKLLQSKHESLRAHAYTYMIETNNKTEKKYISEGLKDESTLVKRKVLSFIIDKNIRPPFKAIKNLKKNHALDLLKIQSLRAHKNIEAARYLLGYINNINNITETRVIALKTLEKLHLKTLPELPYSLYQDTNHSIRATAIEYWSSINKNTPYIKSIPKHLQAALQDKNIKVRQAAVDAIAERKEYWSSQILYPVLFKTTENIAFRKYILQEVMKHKKTTTKSNLIRLSKNSDDKLSIDALSALSNYPTQDVINYLRSVYKKPKKTENYRFAATQTLVTILSGTERKKLLYSINENKY